MDSDGETSLKDLVSGIGKRRKLDNLCSQLIDKHINNENLSKTDYEEITKGLGKKNPNLNTLVRLICSCPNKELCLRLLGLLMIETHSQ